MKPRRIWVLLLALGIVAGAVETDSVEMLWWLLAAVPFLLWKRVLAETAVVFGLAYLWWVIVGCVVLTPPGVIGLTAAITACLLVGFWLVGRTRRVTGWISSALGDSSDAPVPTETQAPRKTREWGWLALGFAVVAGALALLEIRQPFFFAQDDNFDLFMPMALMGGRSLLSGALCTFSPYQFCGSPVATVPQSILLYPPTYVSYLLSKFVLGSEYYTMDVFCILHLVAAYFITYWVARYLGMRAMLASVGSVAVALSGYCLIGGRSWSTIPVVAAVFPVAPGLVMWLQRGAPARRWMVLTAVFVAWLVYTGYVQSWIYTLMFLFVALGFLVWTGELALRRALLAVPALIGGVGVAAPLWVPQVIETMRFVQNRSVPLGQGIGKGILALVLPYPLVKAPHPEGFGNIRCELMGQMYYSGTFFYAVAFLLLAALVSRGWNKRVLGRNVWLVCAGLAFLFALGDQGVLFTLMAQLPIVGKLTGPFKFLSYLNVLVFLGSGIAVERILRTRGASRRLEAIIGLGVIGAMMYHCNLALPAFYLFGDKPYPRMDPGMLRMLRGKKGEPYRMFSIVPERSSAAGYTLALKHSFPAVYRVPSSSGRDPCVDDMAETSRAHRLMADYFAKAMRAYGVKWLIAHKMCEDPVLSPNPVMSRMEMPSQGALELARDSGIRLWIFGDVWIYELPAPDPMAFERSYSKRVLPVRLHDYDMRVDASSLHGIRDVVVNVLWRPWINVSADGRRLDARSDEWGRTAVSVPARTRELTVNYSPPWTFSLLVGAELVALATVIGVFVVKRSG